MQNVLKKKVCLNDHYWREICFLLDQEYVFLHCAKSTREYCLVLENQKIEKVLLVQKSTNVKSNTALKVLKKTTQGKVCTSFPLKGIFHLIHVITYAST